MEITSIGSTFWEGSAKTLKDVRTSLNPRGKSTETRGTDRLEDVNATAKVGTSSLLRHPELERIVRTG